MSAEVIATVAVGAPASLIAVIAYIASRTKDQRAATREMFADLLAPVLERLSDVEEDVQELRRHDRPHTS